MPTTKDPIQLDVLTNQLHLRFPPTWERLQSRYTLWRYYLSERQNNYRCFADKKWFYARFTNSYKNLCERPFLFFGHDELTPGTKTGALYTLLPVGETPREWRYRFGTSEDLAPEVISVEEANPAKLPTHVLIKLLLALSFYEAAPDPETAHRVCQSTFYLVPKAKNDTRFLTAVRFDPRVSGPPHDCMLRLDVAAQFFGRVDGPGALDYTTPNVYYELFVSQGRSYLRQVRPNAVHGFTKTKYRRITSAKKRPQVDWHRDSSSTDAKNWQRTRAFLVRHVQEQLADFLPQFGVEVQFPTERMTKLPVRALSLPIQQLAPVQVVDNRITQADAHTTQYVAWLNSYPALLNASQTGISTTSAFELVTPETVSTTRPLLVLNDASRAAFAPPALQSSTNDEENDSKGSADADTLGLLAAHGFTDPYWALYNRLPGVVKQSLNVNLNDVDDFEQPADYLTYPAPQPAASLARGSAIVSATETTQTDTEAQDTREALDRSLEVCLTELWLKWVLAGKAGPLNDTTLPLFSSWTTWGFVHGGMLLYTENDRICFADLDDPAGIAELNKRFPKWSAIKKRFRERTFKKTDEEAEPGLRNAHFVLLPQRYIEIEQTKVIAMPNWPAFQAAKALNPSGSAKSREAIGVYAGGIWYDKDTHRYVVSGTQSSNGREAHGHHFYQLHCNGLVSPEDITVLLQLLSVTFVRNKRYTVWPYPFDLLRLHSEIAQQTLVE